MRHRRFLSLLLVAALFLLPTTALAATQPGLGSAKKFAVLAGSTITNVPTSAITGDVGLDPGSTVSGFSLVSSGTGFFTSTQVVGQVHINDDVARQAKSDLGTAYTDAASAPTTLDLSGQDLGGMTLGPGVYSFSSSAQLTGPAPLTLSGDAAGVFIFKIAGTLTTASNSQITLVGGASACGVYWQVGSANLGLTTHFEGTLMAMDSITMGTGASMNGRALARNGAVRLDNDTITVPACAEPTTTTLGSSSNPSTVGSSVTYTATVVPTPDGGTMAFTDNTTTLSGCAAVAVNTTTGEASCTTSYSAVGSHSILASYSGDTNYTASSGSLTQQVNAPSAYTTQSPNRILDTRSSHQTLGAGGSLNLTVAGGSTGVPASAIGVVLNVTVTNTSASSLLTVWPAGQARPITSNLNWVAGETRPNLVNVPVGAGGQVSIFNAKGSADVVVDEEGYFAAAVGTAGGYNALSPARLLDTRLSHQTMNTGSLIDLQILGAGGVPATGVSAVVLNATATNTASAGLLTLYPSGTTRPTASNVNWAAGWTIANRVIVKVGTNGKVSIYNAKGSADVVVDVNGYFTDATASGKFFTPLSPVRVLDTRLSGGTLGPKGTYSNFQVTGTHGVPAGATAVFLNTTVTNTTASSALIVYPNARPTASDLNWKKGQTIPNLTLATLSSTGTTNFYNADGSTDLVLDLSGYFGP